MRSLTAILVAAVLLAFSGRADALRPVRVYETNVSSRTDPALMAQVAMRVVLVRATGARDAANDPALADLLANAQDYVLLTRPAASGGGTTVVFDAAAVERDVLSAGRALWATERPLLLIILHGGPASGAFESRRKVEAALDEVSTLRGLPIRVARPEGVGLPTAGDILPEAALAAAQRLEADAVLVGNGDSVTQGGAWRWTLTGAGIAETWVGALEDGVHNAADILARNAAAYAALPELTVLVEVSGVTTLRDYARVAELLSESAGVRAVQLAEAADTSATFAVTARGGGQVIDGALAGNARFERIDPAAGGSLAYRYKP